MGTHLKVLNKSYLMNTNMTRLRWFSKIFASLCFGRKKPQHLRRVKMKKPTRPHSHTFATKQRKTDTHILKNTQILSTKSTLNASSCHLVLYTQNQVTNKALGWLSIGIYHIFLLRRRESSRKTGARRDIACALKWVKLCNLPACLQRSKPA